MTMNEADWPPTLEYFFQWTQRRSPNRKVMQTRFGLLLETHAEYLPRTIVKITGTNGKGSVCAMLAASLQADGKSVGLFTSPHLTRVNERIRINSIEISNLEMEEYAVGLRCILEKWIERMGLEYLPSFFEILILIALRAFNRAAVDVAIFEAGIGGTNDAVSLLPGQLAAITSVGMDHCEILGDSLCAIAIDKAGIASPNTPLVLGPNFSPDVIEAVMQQCRRTDVPLVICDSNEVDIQSHSLEGIHFICSDSLGETVGFLNLAGLHQVNNLVVVLKLLSILHEKGIVTDFAVACSGLSAVDWPCRLTLIEQDPRWLLDVAHNAHAIEALTQSLNLLLPFSERVLLFGAAQNKDYLAYLDKLSELAPVIYLVDGFHRATSVNHLAKLLNNETNISIQDKFTSIESAVEALNVVLSTQGKTIVVAGSVFLAGAVLNALNHRNHSS
jgi:dihydrofolate synthase/folylpolyglutamate synthase